MSAGSRHSEAAAPAIVAIAGDGTRERLRARWKVRGCMRFSRMREDRLFLLLAVLIGIFSGLAVVCFRLAIEWTQITLLGPSLAPSFPRVVLAPTIAGIWWWRCWRFMCFPACAAAE